MNTKNAAGLALVGLALIALGSAPASSEEVTAAVAPAAATDTGTLPGAAPGSLAAELPVPSGPPQRLGPRRKLETAAADPIRAEIRRLYGDRTYSTPK